MTANSTLPLAIEPTYPTSMWWVAARSADIGRYLTPVTVAGLALVLYRSESGAVVALDDACPHRWLPLSGGSLEGESVRCGYHGIVFGPDGSCQEIPSQDRIPARMCVVARPIVERPPWVWVWTGPVADANEDAVPQIPGIARDGWETIDGAMPLAANYLRGHENVLDLTHFEYVHPGTVGTPEWTKVHAQVELDGDGLTVLRDLPNSPAAPSAAPMGVQPGSLVDRRTAVRVPTPAVHIAETLLRSPAGDGDEFQAVIVHAFTPCDDRTSLYFFAIARDWRLGDAELSASQLEITEAVFAQDKTALEAVERVALREHPPDSEVSVRADQAGLQLRRFVTDLVNAETSPHDEERV